ARADVNLSRGSEMQDRRAELATAMVGYIRYVAANHEKLARELPGRRDMMRDKLRPKLAGCHPRTPDAVAALAVGFGGLLSYAVNVGALDEVRARLLLAHAEQGLIEAARAHVEATKGGDPATRFMELLRSLFASGKAYARDKKTEEEPPGHEGLGWEDETDDKASSMYRVRRGADFVGWADGEYLYLDREAAYAAVASFAGRGAIPFGVKPRAAWDALKRAGINLADEGRADTTTRVKNKSRRVVQIPRTAFFGGDEGDEFDE
ncbi:MAG: hypothetical protein M3R38_31670, partial [Actinomycetota bacterium]|nr:hypothetical protein [Actinomycetota bacterium]